MFNRLVGRAVFADADRIVRQNINHPNTHQGRQTHGRTHIIGKDQKSAAERNNSAVQRQAVHYRTHRMFADTVKNLITVVSIFLNRLHGGNGRIIGGGQIRRTADDFGNIGNDGFQTELRGFAGGKRRFFLQLIFQQRFQIGIPSRRQHGIDKGGKFGTGGRRQLLPGIIGGYTALSGLTPGIKNIRRNFERRVIPLQIFAHGGQFFGAER